MEEKIQAQTSTAVTKIRPPGFELAFSLAVWIWGILFSYFPVYASIPIEWVWLFKGLSYICYFVAALIGFVGLRNLSNSQFQSNMLFGVAIWAVAFLLHFIANHTSTFIFTTFIRLIVLFLVAFGLMYILFAIPYLFIKPKIEQLTGEEIVKQDGTVINPQPKPPTKSRFEIIAGIIIAIFALLTALVPLIKAWFQIQ